MTGIRRHCDQALEITPSIVSATDHLSIATDFRLVRGVGDFFSDSFIRRCRSPCFNEGVDSIVHF